MLVHPNRMNVTLHLLLVIACGCRSSAVNPESISPSRYIQGPHVFDGQSVSAWIDSIISDQRTSGQIITVQVPLVLRSMGWGCRCPEYFIGSNPDTHDGGNTWVTPQYDNSTKSLISYLADLYPEDPDEFEEEDSTDPEENELDEVARFGGILIVEGYFIGTRTELDMRDEYGEPEEWLYQTWDLKIQRVLGPAGQVRGGEKDAFVYSGH